MNRPQVIVIVIFTTLNLLIFLGTGASNIYLATLYGLGICLLFGCLFTKEKKDDDLIQMKITLNDLKDKYSTLKNVMNLKNLK